MTATVWLTRAEAAGRLSTSVVTVDRLIREHRLPIYRLPGRRTVRLKAADVDGLLMEDKRAG